MIDLLGRRGILRERWARLRLSQQFAVAGGMFTVAAMVVCGIITTTFMTETMVRRRGDAIAVTTHHIIAPIVRDLLSDGKLGADAIGELDALMADRIFSSQFPYLDIWLADGTIVYSNVPGIMDQKLALPRPVAIAFGGNVVATFTDIDAPDYPVYGFSSDFVEVYFPLRPTEAGDIVAVAELREITTTLENTLWSVTLASWTTVAFIAAVVMTGLFGIVREGSRTIDRQRRTLSKRLQQSHARATRHRQLKEEAQQASRSVTELTDMHLRTIGTDLHDGPAQSIGYAVLKLEHVRRLPSASERAAVVSEIETVLGDALGEIRAIATAMVLPDIVDLDLVQVIDRAVNLHLRRTGTVVNVDSRVDPVHVDSQVAVCVFRFIQEGLNNAFHHGLSEGQSVMASLQGGVLKLSITNHYVEGTKSEHADHLGIGLYGLRARVQSIGGSFGFTQANGETRLEMWLPGV